MKIIWFISGSVWSVNYILDPSMAVMGAAINGWAAYLFCCWYVEEQRKNSDE